MKILTRKLKKVDDVIWEWVMAHSTTVDRIYILIVGIVVGMTIMEIVHFFTDHSILIEVVEK